MSTSSSPPTAGGGARCASPTSSGRKVSPGRGAGGSRKGSTSSSVLNSVNKSTSQFKKYMNRRSGSPIDWFPRKKTESYLKRKIKRLQETDGMTASLQDTLGNVNPHYTRMAREKIAAREAATKAMEARKAALVEASWCRILHAARIQNKEAKEVLEKAKLHATKAFEEARLIGVMMYDRPDCPNQQYEVESSPRPRTGGRSTHKVTASFQTCFEVDMEVAAAVKKAFVRLANSSDSTNKGEFKELLWKISQNPDANEADVNFEAKQKPDDCSTEVTNNLKFDSETCTTSIPNVQQPTHLVNIMLERIKALHEDELASLAVIVAISGLNAALQSDRGKYHETTNPANYKNAGSQRSQPRRYSTAASFIDIQGPKKETMSELPSLDKFLVKHLSKFEREVQEAREVGKKATSAKFDEEDFGFCNEEPGVCKAQSEAVQNNDLNRSCDARGSGEENNNIQACYDGAHEDKENKILVSHQLPPSGAKGNQGGKRLTRVQAAKFEVLKAFCPKDGNSSDVGLGSIFVKPLHRLEKEKMKEFKQGQNNVQKGSESNGHSVSLDDILVKHVSRLEREKMEYEKRNALGEGQSIGFVSHDQRKYGNNATTSESLDQVLVKHVSRLEREKMEYEKRNASGEGRTDVQNNQQKHSDGNTSSASLDQILVKHVSRLEKEKMEHEKKGKMILLKKSDTKCADGASSGGLADILVKRPTKHEQVKQAHAAEEKSTSGFNHVEERRRAREKELLDAWGGLGLGNSMKPHLSKFESDKAEWRKSEEGQKQERSRAREKELLDAWGGVGLGNSMKPHISKIEREKAEWRKSEEEQNQTCATREV